MDTYIYYDNRNGWINKEILVVQSFSITSADIFFQDETGFNPIKCPWIGCSIVFGK